LQETNDGPARAPFGRARRCATNLIGVNILNKVTVISAFLAAMTLGIVAMSLRSPDYGYDFLRGSNRLDTRSSKLKPNQVIRLDRFCLHKPYDEAWGAMQNELCAEKGWHLGSNTSGFQTFVLDNRTTISLCRGRWIPVAISSMGRTKPIRLS